MRYNGGMSSGDLPPELARRILQIQFPSATHARGTKSFLPKHDRGTLGNAEEIELDQLLDMNDLLSILKSKARRALGLRNDGEAPRD
jgi:hypothetical protein